jgi:hypothetical protein
MRNHVFKESKLYLSLPFLQPYCSSNASLVMVCEYNQNVLTALCTKFKTFPFLLISLGVSCCQLKICLWHILSMSWLWVTQYLKTSIFLELSPLLFSTIGMKILKDEFNSSWYNISIYSRKKIMVSLWRSLKTVVTHSLFSYLGISGSRFL